MVLEDAIESDLRRGIRRLVGLQAAVEILRMHEFEDMCGTRGARVRTTPSERASLYCTVSSLSRSNIENAAALGLEITPLDRRYVLLSFSSSEPRPTMERK